MSEFKIKTPHFEGPLELLLDLIEKRKLFVNDISLASVADEFIQYVERLGHLPVRDTAQFLLIASTLLLIKSKSLLPNLSLTDDEQGDIQDLERRLVLYKRAKELAEHVKERFGKKILFMKSERRTLVSVFAPHKSITQDSTLLAVRRVIESLPKTEKLPEVMIRKVQSLEDTISDLSLRITKAIKLSFREFAGGGKAEKVNVIVSFLAMLELVKRGSIDVLQNERYADIEIESQEIGVPRYH